MLQTREAIMKWFERINLIIFHTINVNVAIETEILQQNLCNLIKTFCQLMLLPRFIWKKSYQSQIFNRWTALKRSEPMLINFN